MIGGLLVELRDEIGPSIGELPDSRSLVGASGRSGVDVYEYDRETVTAEGVYELAGVLYDLADRVRGGIGDDTFLKVDDDEGGFGIESRYPAWCSPWGERKFL